MSRSCPLRRIQCLGIDSSAFIGCTRLTDSVYLLDPKSATRSSSSGSLSSRTPTPPDIVIIFSWGNAAPKHIAKYIGAYRDLYPSTRIILVTASTLSANFRSRTSSRLALRPVVELLQHATNKDEESRNPPKILIHILSNSGLVNFISVSEVYRELLGTDSTLPHVLLVLDSTPGGDSLIKEHNDGPWVLQPVSHRTCPGLEATQLCFAHYGSFASSESHRFLGWRILRVKVGES